MSPWNVSQTPWSPHDWPMSPATNPYIPFQPLEDGSDASTWQLPSQAWNGFDATGWPIVTSDDVDAGTLSYLSQMDQNDRALSSFSGPQYCTSPSDVEAYFPSEQIWPTSCADSVLGSIVNCIPASGVAPLCVRDDCSGPMHYANPGHGAALALSPVQDHGLSMRASIARAQTIQAAVYRSDSCCSGVVEPTGQHMAPLHPIVRSVSHPVASHRQASTVAYQPAPFAFSPSYPGNRSLAFLPLALEDSLPADFGTSVPIKQEVQSPTHDHSCGPYGLDLAHPGLALPSDCRVFGPQTSMTATAGRPPLHVPEAAMAPMQHLGLDRMYHTGQIAEDDDGRHRTHPYYSRPAQADGRYHCPWKVQRSEDQCKHEPTKLKCNYDKYIDSHVKPFRCKHAACSKQHFSSTACLLRHEREAHAMHGHGDKPHLCQYPSCDRAKPGNGFPRKYNLLDHMKRVHPYAGASGKSAERPGHGRKTPKDQRAGAKRKAVSPVVMALRPQRQRSAPSPDCRETMPMRTCGIGYPYSGHMPPGRGISRMPACATQEMEPSWQ